MKIYVASSWRNDKQSEVVKALRKEYFEVYDFKQPVEGDNGFHWSEIDIGWKDWTPQQYRRCLEHPIAKRGYNTDFAAMEWADVFIGVQPFGVSASLEMGWAAGAGKPTVLLLDTGEPELMVKMLDFICCDMAEVINVLRVIGRK